jgi:dienelactone hydrolase
MRLRTTKKNRRGRTVGVAVAALLAGSALGAFPGAGVAHADSVQLTVGPQQELRDQALSVFKITGLTPGQDVTVGAQSTDLPGGTWNSTAEFAADTNGTVDLTRQAPISGSYGVADPMGLFWSLTTSDPTVNTNMTLSAYNLGTYHVALTVTDSSNNTLASDTVTRTSATNDQPVTRTVWNPLGYEIDLYYPTNQRAKATVVDVTGSGGGRLQGYCEMLAAHGYFAACVPYFGETGTTSVLTSIPLEFFKTAIQTVLSYPKAVGNKVIFSGPSYGSNAALLLAQTYPDLIKGVIALNAGSYVLEGLEHEVNPSAPPDPAWTLNGQPVPFLTWGWDIFDNEVASGPPPWPLLPAWQAAISRATPDQLSAATIKVDQIHGPVFLSGGGQDAIWDSATMCDQLKSELNAAGNQQVTEFIGPNAGHYLFNPAYTPSAASAASVLQLGGTADANAQANAQMWPALLNFLDTNFGQNGQ